MTAPDRDDPAVAYDAARIAGFFDTFGEQEWLRLDSDAAQKISFHLHRRLLERQVTRGDEVLEIGAGPGRFTLELLRLGATITVTDVSPVQLELNRTRIAETSLAEAIAEWRIADVTNLTDFGDDSFDGTLALGGPLSYVLDRRDQAVDEMVRVTRSKGYVAVSVMSRAGAFREFLSGLSTLYESGDAATLEVIDRSVATGNLVDRGSKPKTTTCTSSLQPSSDLY
jgi:ubiquinone/menaquinone biosynthesis C-methylase UbiE